MGHVLLSMTYARTALIRGIENAHKYATDSRAYANRSFMEGLSSGFFLSWRFTRARSLLDISYWLRASNEVFGCLTGATHRV